MRSQWITGGCMAVCAGALVAITSNVNAQATLTPLATFGGGDGWRAPGEVLVGDTAGTTTPDFVDGSPYYNYLNSPTNPRATPLTLNSNTERGFAYNPVTGNLVLVSRSSAGNGIRLLNGTTGVDVGALNQGAAVITPAGGSVTFAISMAGVASDGAIYVGNLSANGGQYNIYRWANEAAATPTVAYAGASPLAAARTGDTLDVIGSGAATRLVAGYGTGGAGTNGYAIFTTGDGLTYAGSSVAFAGADPTAGDFRLGATFGPDANTVYGKQASQGLEVTSYAGTVGTSLAANVALTSLGEAPIDFATVGGIPLLAALDINNSVLRVYNVSTPATPVLLASATTTAGTLDGNANGTGQVKFGAISGNTATLYAMSTNQGIQALTLTLPTSADDADFDADGDVDGADFLTWQRNNGGAGGLANGDANNDAAVNGLDLAIWQNQFGAAVTVASAIPEPAAATLIGLATLILGARRRR